VGFKGIRNKRLIEEILKVDPNQGIHGVSIQVIENDLGLAPIENLGLSEAIR
jgi:hypothetical protein